MTSDLAALPDYSALKKLAAALWQQDSAYHGAAVMVGAGFSRSAAVTGDVRAKLPLWYDFSKTLSTELGSESADALRLAEEYSAFFGQQALHDLIKREINDAAWQPSDLHKSLLDLPWSEVLTTNWDTLLERASTDVYKRVYSIVYKQEDLSSARSPRIVKLHGTLNINDELIFTQEDYRKYPQRQAAFVNFSRQVFIENELCLIGFSGDDPNFLQWAGWVRDHLSTHSRRIYLVGALNLNSAKRKYLESLNVAPIDLSVLVAHHDDHDTKHREATRIFITALKQLKPTPAWDWRPTRLHPLVTSSESVDKMYNDPAYGAELLKQQIPKLQADRKSYPGWLVCPSHKRIELQSQMAHPYPSPANLALMEPNDKTLLLYEIAWRQSVTDSTTLLWLANEFLQICDPSKPCVLTKKQQLEIAFLLLKNSRWLEEKNTNEIEANVISILAHGDTYLDSCSNEVAYHLALQARDNLDYKALQEQTNKIAPIDPVWKLKKASLHSELGDFDKGEPLVSEAYQELLKQYRLDKNSIYILSRLAWAEWISRGLNLSQGREFQPYPSTYSDLHCSAWDYIKNLQEKIAGAVEKQRKLSTIQPLFEPGSYKDNSKTVTLTSEEHTIVLFDGLLRTVGIPLRWNHANFFLEQAGKLAGLHDDIIYTHRLSLAIRSANSETSGVLDAVLSRMQVACWPIESVEKLSSQAFEGIHYWRDRLSSATADSRGHIMERLRVLIEVLARLSVRSTPQKAKETFSFAVSLGKDSKFRHHWLFKALGPLLEFSLKSIPEAEQHEVLLDALSFPLATEIGASDTDQWPNPIVNHPGTRAQNYALDHRIDQILESLTTNSRRNFAALLRLIPLVKSEFLTPQELNTLAEKVWGTSPDYRQVPETGLLTSVLLELPAIDDKLCEELIKRVLFKNSDKHILYWQTLADLSNLSWNDGNKYLPTEDQAVMYFNKIVTWTKLENDIFGQGSRQNAQMAQWIGNALASSIAPQMPATFLNEENFAKLLDLHTRLQSSDCLSSFVYFAVGNEKFAERVAKLIRQSLSARDAIAVAHAAYALLKWRELQSSPFVEKMIAKLIYLIESGSTTGLSALLRTAKDMIEKNYLTESEIESVAEAVPIIFDDTDYNHIDPHGLESVSVSLARAACVKLANVLLNKNTGNRDALVRILQEAKNDALPEVRFA